jgi:hypothetical protein
MESFLSFFSKSWPRKPNSIPPLKPIHFEKKLFSAAPKDSLQRTVNYRYRPYL